MAEFPAMPFWTDAYLADTTHLSTTEHGAYLLLLMAMWRTAEKKLPNDPKLLARFCKLTRSQWERSAPILMAFFTVDGDSITQGRLTDEATFVRRKSTKQSNNAKARWLKNKTLKDAVAPPDACRIDAPTPTPTPKEEKKEEDAPNGARAPTEEKQLFDRGVQVLGPKGRGLVAKLLATKGRNIALTRAALETASTKSNPAEYIGALLRGVRREADIFSDPLAGVL